MADSNKAGPDKTDAHKTASSRLDPDKAISGKADHYLDTKGLSCPLPILKARKALSMLAAGESLQVEATDAGSVADFAAFCRTTGNELLESKQSDVVYTFLIRKPA